MHKYSKKKKNIKNGTKFEAVLEEKSVVSFVKENVKHNCGS